MERRRYERHSLKLDADLVVKGSISLPCVILDFCPGGLFLDLTKSEKNITSLQDEKVKVLFSLSAQHETRDFQVNAQVMRVCSNGVGVRFDNLPESAFNALRKEANLDSELDAYTATNKSIQPENRKDLKTSLTKLLEKKLPLLITDFYKRVNEELTKATEKVLSLEDQAAYGDAKANLEFNRKSIENEFFSLVQGDIDQINKVKSKENSETDAEENEFSLIGKDEFEDWLNLISSIRKLESLFDTQLYRLEQKISYITGIPKNAINNPLSPLKICENFREAIAEAENNISVKQTYYKVFETVLIDQLANLYKRFEKILMDHGAPEKLALWAPDQTPRDNTERFVDTSGFLDQQQPIISNNVLPFPDPQETSRRPLRHKQSIAQTMGNLLNLFSQTPVLSPEGNIAQDHTGSTNANLPNYSTEEILAAIAQLQNHAVEKSYLYQNTASQQSQLLKTLPECANGAKQLSEIDSNNLEIVGRLFETLLNDLTLSADTKSYLQNLNIPLLNLALQDADFLNSETHPARNILNQLASLEGVINDNSKINNQNIKQLLDDLIARIAQESTSNPDVFANVEQELNEITGFVTRPRDANIRRVIEVCEGKQKIEKARRAVKNEIDQRIAGKSVPKIITTLMEAGWQHLIVLSDISEGENNEERLHYLTVIDQLQLWLSNQKLLTDEQQNSIQEVLQFIDEQLGSVCPNTFLHKQIITELTDCLLGCGNPRIRKKVAMVDVEQVDEEAEDENNAIQDYWSKQADQLEVGDWVTFFTDASKPEPLKTVWIGETHKSYVFVNQKGEKSLELNQEDLAERMRNGSATKIENLDVPLMDRASETMLQNLQEKLQHNTIHDPVTDLLNSQEFVKRLNYELSIIDGSRHMLGYVEIQDFRIITNICGLEAGNKLLEKISNIITEQLGKEEIIARLGDNTFGLLIKHCTSEEGYEKAQQLQNQINDCHFEWEDKSYTLAVNMGLVSFIDNGNAVDTMLQQADSACISANRIGSSGIQIYQDDDDGLKTQQDIHEWAGRIDQVFSENRLFVRCQKIIPLNPENKHSHYEILLGVKDEDGQVIPPDSFIPAAERCRRMPEIDRWIVKAVFDWIELNSLDFDSIGGFAINLSGQSLSSQEFFDFLKDILESSPIQAEKITFEITETAAAEDMAFVAKFIKKIKQMGCKFSLDDFGTGYSSYSYLKSLNIDYLKIDGAFIKEITTSETDAAMVKSMNEIGHSLGLETIAEYVENEEIQEVVREIGVDYAQGWGVQKPMLLEDLVNLFFDF